jgi:hypothetical protein
METTMNNAERINHLAYEQAILAHENETLMDAETAAQINRAAFRSESERRQFKHDFHRHMRNIAAGNRFYQEAQ